MIDYDRLYAYRFRGVDQGARQAVWNEIAPFIHRKMGSPDPILDPAAGLCEFVNALPSVERWIVDAHDYGPHRDDHIKVVIADIFEADVPRDYFAGVFISNFLEHLESPDSVARLLAKMRDCLRSDGTIAILGPNFKYCARDYFDFADHTLALSHVAVAEHVHAAGFEVTEIIPRLLPVSFRGILPPSPVLTRQYLRMPFAWPFLGKQFLVIGRKA